ncbi:arginase family protein [Dethiosulfovibrio sp. F2B]|uniref:arginase family protein n=1 Tax=Dethiosulfovibrio faecalis TaxID=2720018 RepID=UPI001F3ECA6F|nr:arginase family protein [Dethiosulfovibrio faecalis]MCF4152266.1 arginase family protein [Dethiosulfovibrio faecalis]
MERVDMPITGICSFGKYPICGDADGLEADMAVLGVPYDLGVGFLSGTRLGPRRIREASTQYARGSRGFYDPELAAILRGIAGRFNVVCLDLVEVAPQYDPSGATCRIAAMTLLEFMGHILKRREAKN